MENFQLDTLGRKRKNREEMEIKHKTTSYLNIDDGEIEFTTTTSSSSSSSSSSSLNSSSRSCEAKINYGIEKLVFPPFTILGDFHNSGGRTKWRFRFPAEFDENLAKSKAQEDRFNFTLCYLRFHEGDLKKF